MRVKSEFIAVIFLVFFTIACSSSHSDVSEEPYIREFPTIIKGNVDGRNVGLIGPENMRLSIYQLLHTYPGDIIGKELIYDMKLLISDNLNISLNLSNPIIHGQERQLDAFEGDSNFIYATKGGTTYVPDPNNPISIWVKNAICFSYERNEYFIHLIVNGTLIKKSTNLNPSKITLNDLSIEFLSSTISKP